MHVAKAAVFVNRMTKTSYSSHKSAMQSCNHKHWKLQNNIKLYIVYYTKDFYESAVYIYIYLYNIEQ